MSEGVENYAESILEQKRTHSNGKYSLGQFWEYITYRQKKDEEL